MSSSIVRRDMSAAVQRYGASRRTTREVSRAVEQVAGNAIVHAARAEAGAYVAHVGMAYADTLAGQELLAAEAYPEAAGRFRAIADAYTGVVIAELHQMAYE